MRKPLQLLGLGTCLACTSLAFGTGGANDITAVSGRTSKDYVRTRQADGSFKPEYYTFGEGGNWSGAMRDISIDHMKFLDVAHTIADPLAEQHYIPSKDSKTTNLLIMVYWGTTHAREHESDSPVYNSLQDAQDYLNRAKMSGGDVAIAEDELTTAVAAVGAENRIRDQVDALNARMLGYDSWWASTGGDFRGTPLEFERKDLINEIEENRYFVVLMAYDFQLLWKAKKHKLLWETRFSIRQMHHQFDKDLPAMAQFASQFFGQDSNGLVHKAIPLGRVEIGDVKSLGEVRETQTAPAPTK